QGCCCFNMQERIEWSRANNVTPPAWVQQLPEYQRALAQLNATSACLEKPTASTGCCSHCHVPVSCPPGAVACEVRTGQTPAVVVPVAKSPSDEKKPSTRWLVLLEAQACMGTSLQWVASGAVLPTP